jgi:hypothetical protein
VITGFFIRVLNLIHCIEWEMVADLEYLGFPILVGEPKGVGLDGDAILVTVPIVVGVRAVLDIENGVAEASLAER